MTTRVTNDSVIKASNCQVNNHSDLNT